MHLDKNQKHLEFLPNALLVKTEKLKEQDNIIFELRVTLGIKTGCSATFLENCALKKI